MIIFLQFKRCELLINVKERKKHSKVVASNIKSIIFIGQMLPDIETTV